jgi:hypothetical protein
LRQQASPSRIRHLEKGRALYTLIPIIIQITSTPMEVIWGTEKIISVSCSPAKTIKLDKH